MLQIWRSLKRFEGRSSVDTWCYRVALNTALSWRRSTGRKKKHLPAEATDDAALRRSLRVGANSHVFSVSGQRQTNGGSHEPNNASGLSQEREDLVLQSCLSRDHFQSEQRREVYRAGIVSERHSPNSKTCEIATGQQSYRMPSADIVEYPNSNLFPGSKVNSVGISVLRKKREFGSHERSTAS